MCKTGFSNAIWGKVTHSYAKSASSFTNTKFGTIVQDAWPFMNLKSTRSKTEAKEVIEINDDNNDEQGNLVDNSNNDDDDKDCKIFVRLRLSNLLTDASLVMLTHQLQYY